MRLKNNTKEFFIEKYIIEKKSIAKIAKEINMSEKCVKKNLVKYGIEIRKLNDDILTKEFLSEEYLVKMKSSLHIADEFGFSKAVILSRLKKYDIPTRSNSRLGRASVYFCGKKISKGDNFNKLTTLNLADDKGCKWNCLCDCGNEIIVNSRDLNRNRIKSCGCLKKIAYEGYEDVSGNLFGIYKRGAENRNLAFDISSKDMWDLFVFQKNKCKISGVLLTLNKPRTASLDRIDSKKGYLKNNIQWVHKTINTMKWNLNHKEFIEWCKIVASNKSNT